MHLERIENNSAILSMSTDELELVANALNEVCHALEEWEFSTRVGAKKPEALRLLHHISDVRQRLDAES